MGHTSGGNEKLLLADIRLQLNPEVFQPVKATFVVFDQTRKFNIFHNNGE